MKKIKILRVKEINKMKVKVFEIVKTGLKPLSQEMEATIQSWLDDNNNIEILTTSQSQHLRENTVFVTVMYNIKSNENEEE
ncbi:MAG: hypothetical protein CMG55_07185 [Candidatus Marinimicrobia bacterium]|nr:hypothetical protein [Candidatus Neomarinimicrobiota bacterium]